MARTATRGIGSSVTNWWIRAATAASSMPATPARRFHWQNRFSPASRASRRSAASGEAANRLTFSAFFRSASNSSGVRDTPMAACCRWARPFVISLTMSIRNISRNRATNTRPGISILKALHRIGKPNSKTMLAIIATRLQRAAHLSCISFSISRSRGSVCFSHIFLLLLSELEWVTFFWPPTVPG